MAPLLHNSRLLVIELICQLLQRRKKGSTDCAAAGDPFLSNGPVNITMTDTHS